ncbi:MAG TPA: ATP-binding protein, partial [Tepidisphaeraceae bacterium]|nr:ATP-binding protein [Tepidisphaeraceae bacterium]
MTEPVSVRVADATQVGQARRSATRIAQAAGLNEQRTGEVAIIASELANNLHRYGGGGEIVIQP